MGKHGKRNPYSYSKAKNILRYVVLAIFVVALLAGVSSVVALLAPYSSYGRIAGNLFQPIYEYGNNLLAAIAAHIDSYAFYSTDVWIRSIPTFVVAALTFVIVAVLAWRNGRTYCNTICPVGTILSFFARFSWFKITIDTDKCRNCGTCGRYCKAACIDFKHHHVDYSRCVVCGDCLGKCEFGALHYVHPKKKTEAVTSSPTEVQEKEEADTSRRSFLLAAALATTAAAMAQKDKKVDGGLAVIEDKVTPKRATPLTPAGILQRRKYGETLYGMSVVRIRMSKRSITSIYGFGKIHATHDELRARILPSGMYQMFERMPDRCHQENR
jgi:Pyruvate/2-oxoacid:ferredoxin oxidoreductase delta subunit